jgi:hypothetical protein
LGLALTVIDILILKGQTFFRNTTFTYQALHSFPYANEPLVNCELDSGTARVGVYGPLFNGHVRMTNLGLRYATPLWRNGYIYLIINIDPLVRIDSVFPQSIVGCGDNAQIGYMAYEDRLLP